MKKKQTKERQAVKEEKARRKAVVAEARKAHQSAARVAVSGTVIDIEGPAAAERIEELRAAKPLWLRGQRLVRPAANGENGKAHRVTDLVVRRVAGRLVLVMSPQLGVNLTPWFSVEKLQQDGYRASGKPKPTVRSVPALKQQTRGGVEKLPLGTKLTGRYRGIERTVEVVDGGFRVVGGLPDGGSDYVYASLSSAAKAICGGCEVNGPRFFGLRKGA